MWYGETLVPADLSQLLHWSLPAYHNQTWCSQTLDRKCGRTELRRKVHLLDVPSHKVGEEKDQTPKQSSDICTQTHTVASQLITLPS